MWDNIHYRPQPITTHQSEGGIGIDDPLTEHQPYNETKYFGHKDTTRAVLSADAVSYLEIVFLPMLIHLPELRRVSLPVTIRLEHKVCT